MVDQFKFVDNGKIKDEEYISMMKETLDSMSESIENVESVIKQQWKLIDVVSKNDENNEFESFIKDLRENAKSLQNQQSELMRKHMHLHFAIETIEKDDNSKRAVINIMKAFGMFEQ